MKLALVDDSLLAIVEDDTVIAISRPIPQITALPVIDWMKAIIEGWDRNKAAFQLSFSMSRPLHLFSFLHYVSLAPEGRTILK